MLLVTAGILIHNGTILIAKRPAGKTMAAMWEFPGGKIEPGETAAACMIREMEEEFAIRVEVVRGYDELIHHYPDFSVKLIFFLLRWTGGALECRDHDDFKWVLPEHLTDYVFLPADAPIINQIAAEGADLIAEIINIENMS